MPPRNSYAWAQLTWAQIDAVLTLAHAVDQQPGDLNRHLPELGQRAAFRGAVAVLKTLKTAGKAVE